MLRIIRTRYLPATDFKGSRIVATDLTTGMRITESYDHAASEPYAVVADKLVTKLIAGRPVRTAKPLGVVNPTGSTPDLYHAYALEFVAAAE